MPPSRMFFPSLRLKAFLTALCVFATFPTARAATDIPIETGRHSSAAAARQAWKEKESSPVVALADPGVVFPCPFDRNRVDRFYWDRDLSMDLSRATSLEVDITCPDPRALRQVSLYFESGAGWYNATLSLKKSGRQTLLLRKDDFSPEGKPAGWNRITRVRLSPWRGNGGGTSLVLHRLSGRLDRVLIVRGEKAIADAGERRVARSATARASDWLAAFDLPHGIVSDAELDPARLEEAAVLVFPYSPALPPSALKPLAAFFERGGRAVVCYSSDAALAGLMGVRLGDYKRAEKPLTWVSFVFPDADRWKVPERLYQNSTNIRMVHPLPDRGETIAWWENGEGKRTGDPAWVATDRGAWMTHILLPEDGYNKRHMLAALVAGRDSDLRRRAAASVLQAAGAIDSFSGVQEAVDSIRTQSDLLLNEKKIKNLLEQVLRDHRTMILSFRDADYDRVMKLGRMVRENLMEAYARVQAPASRELRGLWDHDGTGWYPGDWDRTCRTIRDSGFNAIFINASWPGLAHYRSDLLAPSGTFRRYGDQIEDCLRAARRHGIQVHVWKVCWNAEWAPAETAARWKKEGRLLSSGGTESWNWLDPARDDNVLMELQALEELARRYPIDGIHLDYVRYPSRDSGLTRDARTAFEKVRGAGVGRWPQDVRAGGPLHAEFLRWRTGRINAYVSEAHRRLQAIRPDLKLSAAVFGKYPDCRDSVAQDWGGWLDRGWVDFVCPMDYTENLSTFASLVTPQIQLPAGRGRVFPGIGVTANESQLQADQVIEQIVLARRLGAKGFLLFDLNAELRDRVLPYLRMGLTLPGLSDDPLDAPAFVAPK